METFCLATEFLSFRRCLGRSLAATLYDMPLEALWCKLKILDSCKRAAISAIVILRICQEIIPACKSSWLGSSLSSLNDLIYQYDIAGWLVESALSGLCILFFEFFRDLFWENWRLTLLADWRLPPKVCRSILRGIEGQDRQWIQGLSRGYLDPRLQHRIRRWKEPRYSSHLRDQGLQTEVRANFQTQKRKTRSS